MSTSPKKSHMFRNFWIVVLMITGLIGLDYFLRAHSFVSPSIVASMHPVLLHK
ncbi:MAG: hypothetical protein KGJ07_04145 [Patescibacteria group bacterium]|nr:hypothetical protein [Patescibacteria group bacterium]